MKNIFPSQIKKFREEVLRNYTANGRDFPWRQTRDPYCIFVSEVMLQQTGTERVRAKYPVFIERFPDFARLSSASLSDVLPVWQGMGYNRRALCLIRSARVVVEEFRGALPRSADDLVKLPGIGRATAASIAAFAFDAPTVFIETNIRTVFIHFFFPKDARVHDRDILPLVEATLVIGRPREWYYALMDYGVMLKASRDNPGRRSSHHRKPPRFEGSTRQLRGKVLRALTQGKALTAHELAIEAQADSDRLSACIERLRKEGFIAEEEGRYSLGSGSAGHR